MKVGVIGLGRMGHAMVKRLLTQGFEVHGWDIDPGRTRGLDEAGAHPCVDAAELVDRAEIILSIVTDDAAVRWLFSSAGALRNRVDGKLFVEMSTLQPATVRAAAELVEAQGGRLIGAPVLGSIPTVVDGKLLVLAGGRDEDIERSKQVLSKLARNVLAIGPIGTGNAMKLVVNLTMAAYLGALAEGLAMGKEEGLELEQMLTVLTEAPTANPWLGAKLGVLKGLAAPLTLDIAALHKDVLSAVATGSINGVAMPMAAGVLSTLSAAVATGYGAEDLAQLPKFHRERMVRRSRAADGISNTDLKS